MRTVSVALVLLLAGCSADLAADLDERAAGELVAALTAQGVPADRVAGDRPQRFRVVVPAADGGRAMLVMAERGLPRQRGRGVGEAFAEAGLLPSPGAERARMQAALASDIERQLENIPGVVAARVVLALPAPEPLRTDGARARSTASVVLRVRGVPVVGEGALQRQVAAAVHGLDAADVTVLVTSDPERTATGAEPDRVRVGPLWLPAAGPSWWLLVAAVALLVSAVALAALRIGRGAAPRSR